MRKFFTLIKIIILGLLLCPTALLAQKRDTLAPIELQEILLNHDKARHESHTSPSPVQSLSGEQLKKLNSLSVADALRYFSGIQLKDYGGIGGINAPTDSSPKEGWIDHVTLAVEEPASDRIFFDGFDPISVAPAE